MANEPNGDGATAVELSGVSQSPDAEFHDVTIIVCSTCRVENGSATSPTPGEQFFEAICAANGAMAKEKTKLSAINVVSAECLGNCQRRLSAAIVSSDCWSYVFGDLAIKDAGDLITGARLMEDTPNGMMPWRGRPQSLKSGMIARIPPLSF